LNIEQQVKDIYDCLEQLHYCCMRRKVDNNYENGFFDFHRRFWLGSVFDLHDRSETIKLAEGKTIEQVLADGWIID
jgi:hypothetical protein